MDNRRGDKIFEIEGYLEKFGSIIPNSFDEYINDFIKKAACERYFEKIVEAVIDLVFLVIKEKEFQSPNSDREALGILAKENIISGELSEKLSNAKSMRNIIIHEYGYIDDNLVFNAIKNELVCDVKEFLEAVR